MRKRRACRFLSNHRETVPGEVPCYLLAASLENMCRGYPPPPQEEAQTPPSSLGAPRPPPGGAVEKVARASSWTLVSSSCQSSQGYYSIIPFMCVINSHGKAVKWISGGQLRPPMAGFGTRPRGVLWVCKPLTGTEGPTGPIAAARGPLTPRGTLVLWTRFSPHNGGAFGGRSI